MAPIEKVFDTLPVMEGWLIADDDPGWALLSVVGGHCGTSATLELGSMPLQTDRHSGPLLVTCVPAETETRSMSAETNSNTKHKKELKKKS